MSPLKRLCGCSLKKMVTLSPRLEVTKCLSPLNDMLIYVSTPLRTKTHSIRFYNWSFIFGDNVGTVSSMRSLKWHRSDKLKLFINLDFNLLFQYKYVYVQLHRVVYT